MDTIFNILNNLNDDIANNIYSLLDVHPIANVLIAAQSAQVLEHGDATDDEINKWILSEYRQKRLIHGYPLKLLYLKELKHKIKSYEREIEECDAYQEYSKHTKPLTLQQHRTYKRYCFTNKVPDEWYKYFLNCQSQDDDVFD